MTKLKTIEQSSLSTITGGGTNTVQAQLGVQVPVKGRQQVNVGGSLSSSQTDYAACLQAVGALPGVTPQAMRETCGLPPSSSSSASPASEE